MSDASSIVRDLIVLQSSRQPQSPLYFVIERDDVELLRSAAGEWIRSLYSLDWREFRIVGAQYYQALWEFNVDAARRRSLQEEASPNPELEEDAEERLFLDRPTGGNGSASLLLPEQELLKMQPLVVRPESIAPGVVPFRMAGRPLKCFFGMFSAFIGVHLMGKGASAQEVHHNLMISPPFARACGFTLPDLAVTSRHTDIPGLRKLEQFDQIMSDRGLWSQARVEVVKNNLKNRVIEVEGESLVHDTTHYVAYSSMVLQEVPEEKNGEQALKEAIPQPPPEGEAAPSDEKKPGRRTKAVRREEKTSRREQRREIVQDQWRKRRAKRREQKRKKSIPKRFKKTTDTRKSSGSGAGTRSKKPARKTQSKTIKNCQCDDRQTCSHDWVLADPGAGSIIKGTGAHKKKIWGHKAAVLSTTSGIPLDARAATDAASHDGTLLKPHLGVFFKAYPELDGVFKAVLADKAYDDAQTKEDVEDLHHMKVITQTNPRATKTIKEGLPKGMKSLSPNGILTCQADQEMDYRGARLPAERFIYGPPLTEDGQPTCTNCPLRNQCCRRDSSGGRYVEIEFTRLDHIDPSLPPMARRFKAIMRHRTAVERAIKRIKIDFGDDRLTRRGNTACQAHLDRSLIAFHLMLRQE